MTANTYQPKVVLLTGGAGFIGSNTLVNMVQKYPDVKWICYDKIDYCATVNNFKEVKDHKNFLFVKGDIANVDMVHFVMTTHKVDTVLHFAAQTHVDNSFGNSFQFTKANVFGTHVLLECCKRLGEQIRRFVHVSTDEVYGENEDNTAFNERSALNPTNPYAATKAAAEFIVKAYYQSFKLPIIITRGNNVYGPKQFPEKLIPKFINLLGRDRPCCLHGDGSNRRSFLYVGDVAEAFDVILHKGVVGEIYNIGTKFEITNLETAKTLLKVMGLSDREEELITFVEDRKFNDVRYHIEVDKLEELGWKPKTNFEEGIRLTKDWYLSNQGHFGDIEGALVPHPRVGMSAGNVGDEHF